MRRRLSAETFMRLDFYAPRLLGFFFPKSFFSRKKICFNKTSFSPKKSFFFQKIFFSTKNDFLSQELFFLSN